MYHRTITCVTAQPDSEVLLNSWDSNGLNEQYIREALGPGKADEIVSKGHEIILCRQDLWTLKNHGWLNDQHCQTVIVKCFNFQVINFNSTRLEILRNHLQELDDFQLCSGVATPGPIRAWALVKSYRPW